MSKDAPSDTHSDPDPASPDQAEIPDYKPIADYGVTGDMHSAALIAPDRKVFIPAEIDGSSINGCAPDFARATSASRAYRSLILVRSSSVSSSRFMNAFCAPRHRPQQFVDLEL
jgi:hypothetical protein